MRATPTDVVAIGRVGNSIFDDAVFHDPVKHTPQSFSALIAEKGLVVGRVEPAQEVLCTRCKSNPAHLCVHCASDDTATARQEGIEEAEGRG